MEEREELIAKQRSARMLKPEINVQTKRTGIEGGGVSLDDAQRVCQAFDDAIRKSELEFVEYLRRIVESHGFPGLRAT